VGRCPYNYTKEERVKYNRPKWKAVKDQDMKDRVYFYTDLHDSAVLVLVEDVASAIRVRAATGYTSVALLSTSLGDLDLKIPDDTKVLVWLDSDACSKSIKIVNRLKQLGIEASSIFTGYDPKSYSDEDIKSMIKIKI
jgi:hypothetical protein